MDLDARSFERHAEAHRAALSARGWRQARRVGTSAWKRATRLVRNRVGEYWRTYWWVESAAGQRGFAKVFFGNRAEINPILAAKEVQLVAYFRQQLPALPGITLPVVLDHWIEGAVAYVLLEARQVRPVTLPELCADPVLWAALERLLTALAPIPLPPWWGPDWETHNFGRLAADTPRESPFDFDLDRNLGLDADGSLYFHDFEKRRWARRGMQELVLALKLIGERQDAPARAAAANLLALVRGSADAAVVEAALAAACSSLADEAQAAERRRRLLPVLEEADLWAAPVAP